MFPDIGGSVANTSCHGRAHFTTAASYRRKPLRPFRHTKIGSNQRDNPKTRVLEPVDLSSSNLTVNGDPYETVESLLVAKQTDSDASAQAYTRFVALATRGYRPPAKVCDGLIERLYATKSLAQLCTVYELIVPFGYSFSSYNKYQYVINAYLSIGRLQTAVQIFRSLQKGGMSANKVTYCSLISALGKQRKRGLRNAQLAYELWQELLDSGLQLDPTALNIGMKACVDVGRVEDAAKILEAMVRSSKQPLDARPYNILLKGYASLGRVTEMTRVFEKMKSEGSRPSFVTYNTLVDGFVRSGSLEKARQYMHQAIDAGIELDAWSYTSLMKGLVASKDLIAAGQVLDNMRAAGVKPTCNTYSVLVDGFVRAGNFDKAFEIIDAMIAAGERPSTVTYNTLLRGYATAAVNNDQQQQTATEAGTLAIQRALQLLEDMQAKGVAPASDTFNTLMAAAVTADDPKMALELYARMKAAGLRPDGLTYTTLIQAYSKMSDLPNAVSIFEELSRDRSAELDLPAYNAMVDAFARQGDMAAAEKMLERTVKFASRQGLKPPVEAYGAVVSGYVRLKLVQPAVDTVKRFHASGGNPDVQMLDMLVDVCIRTGEYKMAMQSVRAMELLGKDVDKNKYKALLEAQAQRNADNNVDISASATGRGRAARERRRAKQEKNSNLERFKFWLGLPNQYYNADYSTDDGDSSS